MASTDARFASGKDDAVLARLLQGCVGRVLPHELVARGGYGSVYRVSGVDADAWQRLVDAVLRPPAECAAVRRALRLSRDGPRGDAVVAKVQALLGERFERDAMAEEQCQRRACDAEAAFPDGTVVAGADVVPRPLLGLTVEHGAEDAFRVTLMDAVDGGRSLSAVMEEEGGGCGDAGDRALAVYWSLEKAVAALWLGGVSHSDLHPDNVLVMPDASVRLVDFGMAMALPRRLAHELRGALRASAPRRVSPDRSFDSVCLEHCRRVMQRRGVDDEAANYDGHMLRWVRRRQWLRGRAGAIRKLRDALWRRPTSLAAQAENLGDK